MRFPHAIESIETNDFDDSESSLRKDSEKSTSKKALIQFDIYRQEKKSPRYDGVDMHVDIAFGRLVFNWFPRSINHLMRFFRYNKFPEQIVLDHMAKLKNLK